MKIYGISLALSLAMISYLPAAGPLRSAPLISQVAPATPLTAEEQAILTDNAAAAAAWLKLMDEGKYGESWDAAGQIFRVTVSRDEWKKSQEKLRKPLGALISRTMVVQQPKENPKGLPAGYYMVLAYQTAFANRPKANELLTMALESDGKWRVLTYQSS